MPDLILRSFYIPSKYLNKLEERAKSEDSSVNQVVRNILRAEFASEISQKGGEKKEPVKARPDR